MRQQCCLFYSEEAFNVAFCQSHYIAFHTLRIDKDLNFVSTADYKSPLMETTCGDNVWMFYESTEVKIEEL